MDAAISGVEVEAVEYFQESRTVRTQFDQAKTPASIAVIATLADIMDTDPAALNPLHSTVDPEALDTLVQGRNNTNGDIHITFTHEGYEIRVHSYGVISIKSADEETSAEKRKKGRQDDI